MLTDTKQAKRVKDKAMEKFRCFRGIISSPVFSDIQFVGSGISFAATFLLSVSPDAGTFTTHCNSPTEELPPPSPEGSVSSRTWRGCPDAQTGHLGKTLLLHICKRNISFTCWEEAGQVSEPLWSICWSGHCCYPQEVTRSTTAPFEKIT